MTEPFNELKYPWDEEEQLDDQATVQVTSEVNAEANPVANTVENAMQSARASVVVSTAANAIQNAEASAETAKEADKLSGFLVEDGWQDVDPEPYRLDFTRPYVAPEYTFAYKGVPFAPLSGIQVVTGQPGNGKSNALSMLMAAVLCGRYGELECLQTNNKDRVVRVLYVDTEQEEGNTLANVNRTLLMAGRQAGVPQVDFVVLTLREVQGNKNVTAAKRRWQLVLKAIDQYRPTVCIIDGALDVVEDFNDNNACSEMTNKFMGLASYYKMSLWVVVHQNPGQDKMVGHLGSMVERKATDVFVVEKNKDAKFSYESTFTITQKKARGMDVPECVFRFETVDGWGRPVQIEEAMPEQNGIRPEDVKQWLEKGKGDIEWPATGTTIKGMFAKQSGQHGSNSVQTMLDIARNRRFIIQQSRDQFQPGQNYAKYILNPEEFENDG